MRGKTWRCLTTKKMWSYLNNTTTIGMTRKHSNLAFKSRYNKSNFLCRNAFNTLLNHMIPILVAYTSDNMSIKLVHKLCLLIKLNNLKGLGHAFSTESKSSYAVHISKWHKIEIHSELFPGSHLNKSYRSTHKRKMQILTSDIRIIFMLPTDMLIEKYLLSPSY